MRTSLGIGAFFAASLATATPSFAASYGWPMQLTQPVTLNNIAFTAANEIVLVCSVSRPNSTSPIAEGSSILSLHAVGNGYLTYSGTVPETIDGSSASVPAAGDIVFCQLRLKYNGTFTNLGNASKYVLP